jgi:DNA-binding response OmpR family regulator
MRLLLVEDDESLGETLTSWLQLDGYAVESLQLAGFNDISPRVVARANSLNLEGRI